MSYCRFSTEDFNCDLYCYADCDGGYTTHVAKSKRVWKEPLPPDVPFDEAHADEWLVRHNKVMQMCDDADLVPIGLAHDGAQFNDDTLEEFLDRVNELKAMGYRVPDYVPEAIREEIKEVTL